MYAMNQQKIKQKIRYAVPFLCCAIIVSSTLVAAAPVSESTILPPTTKHIMWQGIVTPSQQSEIGSSVTGQINSIKVVEGQAVKTGDTLVTLDDTVQKAAVTAAKVRANHQGRIELAQVELKLAADQCKRIQKAFDTGGGLAKKELDEAKAARDTAKARYQIALTDQAQAQAVLLLEQQRLAQRTIKAPFDGMIMRIDAKLGSVAEPDVPLLKIVDLSTLKAELHLPIDCFGKMKPNQEYLLEAGLPINKDIVARLVFVEPIIDSATKTFRCVFQINNSNMKLPAGFAVRLKSTTPMQMTRKITSR